MERRFPENLEKIYLLPYSHHDYEWCNTRNWHICRYVLMFEEVLEIMRSDDKYTFHIDNVAHSLLPFLQAHPELKDELAQRVREGRVCVVNGGYGLARPSQVADETFIRNMVAGRRFFCDTFGIESIPGFFNADTGVGHSQVPQLMKLGGYSYYRFERPHEVLSVKGIPSQFRWRGMDGSEVVCTRGLYGGFYYETEWMDADPEADWESYKAQYLNHDFCWQNGNTSDSGIVAQFVGSDDARPKRNLYDVPIPVEKLAESWNRHETSQMAYGTMNQLHAEIADRIPTVEGVLDHAELSYNFPAKGNGSLWYNRLLLDTLLLRAERLCTLAAAMGAEYPEADLRACWTDLFEIAGHAMEFSQARDLQVPQEFIDHAKATLALLSRRASNEIAHRLASYGNDAFVVVNPSGSTAKRAVKVQLTGPTGVPSFDLVTPDGQKLEYQIVDTFNDPRKDPGNEFCGVEILVQVPVPAMGSMVVRRVANDDLLSEKLKRDGWVDPLAAFPAPDAPETVTFNNGVIEAVFKNGALVKMTDTRNGKVMEAGGAALMRPRFLHFPAESSWLSNLNPTGSDEFVATRCFVSDNGPIRYSYTAIGTIAGQDFRVVYSLEKGMEGVDVMVESDFREPMEGLLLCAVPANKDSDVYADVPFGTEKREFFDHLRVNPNTSEPIAIAPCEWDLPGQVYARSSCSFMSNELPVAMIAQHCSIYRNFDRDLGEMQIFLNRGMPIKTRVDRWMGEVSHMHDGTGKHHYEFSIVSMPSLDNTVLPAQYREALLFAPVAVALPGGKKEGETAVSALAISAENVRLSAMYSENGHYIVRAYECDGRATEAELTLPVGTTAATAVDFNGDPIDGVSVVLSGNVARVSFAPHQIVTLALS